MQTATLTRTTPYPGPRPAVVTMAPGPRKFETSCGNCNLRELCLPVGLDRPDMDRLDALVATRRTVARGDSLFRSGDDFQSLYAVRTGFFKTCVSAEDGRDQVTGFQMTGELLGLDGIGSGRYNGNAVALEDSEVCVLPFAMIEELGRDIPAIQRNLHSVLSREIVRQLQAGRVPVTFREIESPWGHDSFLLEVPEYHRTVATFLDRALEEAG